MLRNLLLGTTVALASTSALPVLAQSNSSTEQSQSGTISAVPQDVILATSIIGMPTFIKGEEATAGPIGALADALVSLDGQIVGVVVRTPGNSAFIVPADRLEQANISGQPILVIDVTRDEAENAPDVSSQLPQGANGSGNAGAGSASTTDGGAAAQSGSSAQSGSNDGTSSDNTTASDSTNSSSDASSSDGSASSDTSTDGSSTDSSSSGDTSSGDTSSGDASSGADASSDSQSGSADQTGVTGTTTDGTNAAGADEGSDGTGTEGRAGTDGEAPSTSN